VANSDSTTTFVLMLAVASCCRWYATLQTDNDAACQEVHIQHQHIASATFWHVHLSRAICIACVVRTAHAGLTCPATATRL
jgi:hypothetical protein